MDLKGGLFAALATSLVGSSVAAASLIGDYPILGGQAMRYAFASLLLFAWIKASRRSIPRLTRLDATWLSGVALFGMVLFNVLLILATARVDPSLVGAIVGTAPIVLAVVGALQLGKRPRFGLVGGAVLVAGGTALVMQATVSGDGLGIAFAVGVMLGEVGFSLLAVPALKRLGAIGVSAHSTWIAAAMLTVGALIFEGSEALRNPTPTEAWALVYLAVAVTAVAFVSWYTAVDRLGADTAGLFAGLIPITTLLTSALIGTDTVTPGKMIGVLVVGIGVYFGMRASRTLT